LQMLLSTKQKSRNEVTLVVPSGGIGIVRNQK
jgi:hypothetical protein